MSASRRRGGRWFSPGRLGLCVLIVLVWVAPAFAAVSVRPDGAVLSGEPVHLVITADARSSGPATIWIDGAQRHALELTEGDNSLKLEDVALASGSHALEVRTADGVGRTELKAVSAWLSILPPLVAIGLALIFKDVLISLFLGVFIGAWILVDWNPLLAFARSIDHFIAPALADGDHAKIIIFSTLLGGMVGLISKAGGTQGIVERLRGWAVNARRGQLAAWLMGLFIFFDDYANTLIVGSTMRPDHRPAPDQPRKTRLHRRRHGRAGGRACPISTWIGFEVGLIGASFASLNLPYDPYGMFLRSIPYRFYPILALVLGFVIAFSCRDFGPMLKAELRASHTGKVVADDAVPLADYSGTALAPAEETPKRARNAFLPILTVIGVTMAGLWLTGSAVVSARQPGDTLLHWMGNVLSNANSYDTLLWASLAGVTVALFLSVVQRLLTVRQAMEALSEGFKSMMLAMVVLVLAWSIGAVTAELHTSDFVVGLTAGVVSPTSRRSRLHSLPRRSPSPPAPPGARWPF